MKKIVPAPPISYFSVISDLSREEALTQVSKLMDCMNRTLEAYLGTEPIGVDSYLLENVEILNQLMRALIAHAVAKEAAP